MTYQTSALSNSQIPAFVPQSNLKSLTRPNSTSESVLESPAERLKRHLLDLSKTEENKDFRAILRAAADSVREKAFGYNRKVTKRKILKLLAEFFVLELDDITDETGIAEKEIKAAIADLIADGEIVEGRRRRWQEVGKHYNPTYELVK